MTYKYVYGRISAHIHQLAFILQYAFVKYISSFYLFEI